MQAAGGLISMHRRARPAGRPRRRLAHRPGHRDLGGARRPRRAPRARPHRRGPARSTSRSTRRRSATSATTSPATSPTAPCPHGEGTRFPMVAPYQVFPTRDGELMIAGGNDRLFARDLRRARPARAGRRPALPRRTPTGCATATRSAALLEERARRRTTGALARARSRPRACRPRRSPTSPTSPQRRRPRRSGSSRLPPGDPRPRLPALPLCLDGERALHRSPPPAVGAAHGRDPPRGRLRRRRDRGARRTRSDHDMSHLSASFSATIRVRPLRRAGLVRPRREGGRRRRRLARRDRPRPRRGGDEGARRHRAGVRRRAPGARSSRPSARSTASRSSTSPTARS